ERCQATGFRACMSETHAQTPKKFVQDGGWLMAIDQSADLAIGRSGRPVRSTVSNPRSKW
ncbi:MAG: hypothetical protein ACE1ZA_06760, partial [Pseudomonadales bacterium]